MQCAEMQNLQLASNTMIAASTASHNSLHCPRGWIQQCKVKGFPFAGNARSSER